MKFVFALKPNGLKPIPYECPPPYIYVLFIVVDGDEYNLVLDLGPALDLLVEVVDDLKADPPTLPPLLAA